MLIGSHVALTSGMKLLHCSKSWSAQAWKLLGNVHMCPSLCASMYTAPVYKGWPSSSFSVQGVSKFVHMLCTNWTLAWAHVYISKQFPSLHGHSNFYSSVVHQQVWEGGTKVLARSAYFRPSSSNLFMLVLKCYCLAGPLWKM